MVKLSSDEINELINTFNGALLITFYRSFDLGFTTLSDLVDDVNDDKKEKTINHIAIDVSNMPELCGDIPATPPCTILYTNGRKRYVFGLYGDFEYIQTLSKAIITNDEIVSHGIVTATITQPNRTVTFNTGV